MNSSPTLASQTKNAAVTPHGGLSGPKGRALQGVCAGCGGANSSTYALVIWPVAGVSVGVSTMRASVRDRGGEEQGSEIIFAAHAALPPAHDHRNLLKLHCYRDNRPPPA